MRALHYKGGNYILKTVRWRQEGNVLGKILTGKDSQLIYTDDQGSLKPQRAGMKTSRKNMDKFSKVKYITQVEIWSGEKGQSYVFS